MGLSLRESNEDELVYNRLGSVLVLLQHQLVDRDVFDNFLLFGFLEAKLLEVEALLDGLFPAVGSVSLGSGSFLSSLGCCFGLLLLFLDLVTVLFEASFVPLLVRLAVLFGRGRVFHSQRDAEELHDPGQEFPRRHRFTLLDVIELLLAQANHARAFVRHVVR